MRPETEAWYGQATVEQLQCRELRHAWPRAQRRAAVKSLPGSAAITWKRLDSGELERTMHCIGGCGVARIETFLERAGDRLVRTGMRYRPPKGYRRQRADPETPLERLDVDVLRTQIIMRLYPGLRW